MFRVPKKPSALGPFCCMAMSSCILPTQHTQHVGGRKLSLAGAACSMQWAMQTKGHTAR